MDATRTLLDRARARAPHGDAGTSLLELVVGMAIMAVFMGMFTTAMLAMSNTTNAVQVVSDTTNQATDAYLRLDREIRYSSAISTPAYDTTSGMWHVEFLTTVIARSGTNTVSNTGQCTQLAVAPPSGTKTGVLEQRTWNTTDSAPGSWVQLANSLTNYGSASATSPFPTTVSTAGGNASSSMQQLTIRLILAQSLSSSVSTTSAFTFTALNSSTSNTTPVCQQFAVGS